ncbi:MAG TPA: 30S ribosomal protein S6 [Candidatus Peribacteraceae bacterium]|nr:30S ribosomal protein S6 [Candidatus Peribacteraceae bacterium]
MARASAKKTPDATLVAPDEMDIASEPRLYEFCVLFPHPLAQNELQAAEKGVEGIITETGGKLVLKDSWGRRGLSYKIGDSMEAFIVIYYYELDPDKIRQINEEIRISPNVVRHLVVKPPKGYQVVSTASRFDEWLKEKESRQEIAKHEREEEFKDKVIKRQKAKATHKPEKAATPTSDADKKELSEKIDELISGDELEL